MRHRRAQVALRWVVFLALLVPTIGLIGWGLLAYFRPMVTVSEAVEGPVVQAFYSTGTIQPHREYIIRSSVAGTLTQVNVDRGSRVRQGDVLAVVTDPALEFAEARARAELEEKLKLADPKNSPILREFDARIQAVDQLLQIAQRERQRTADLLETGAGSQTDLDRAVDRVTTLASELESLRAQRAARELELQRQVAVAQAAHRTALWEVQQQTLKSPVDGVVLDRPVSPGTRVAVNDPVMRVANIQPEHLVMRAAVDEEDVARVQIDQLVRMTLYAFPGRVFSGRVRQIYDQADETRRTFEVDVRLDDPDPRLAPGMTGELAFVLAEKDRAVIVPAQAVQENAVWTVRDGRLARLTPTIGIRSVERIEILDGLPNGSMVVLDPVNGFREGQHVRTTWLDPVVAAGLNRPPVEEQPFKAFD